jgi:transposase
MNARFSAYPRRKPRTPRTYTLARKWGGERHPKILCTVRSTGPKVMAHASGGIATLGPIRYTPEKSLNRKLSTFTPIHTSTSTTTTFATMVGVPIDVGVRIQALFCLQLSWPYAQIEATLGVSKSTLYRYQRTAIKRGYDPQACPKILLEYVTDAPRSSRPTKVTPAIEDEIITAISKNSTTRTLTGQDIGLQVSLSPRTIRRVLKRKGYRKVKLTVKLGLTTAMMEARLQFALRYQHWTLEDWKAIIWSDETSVVLGHRRGGHRRGGHRVWRTAKERYDIHVKRTRWKGHSEFMFWGCFTYDKKGPFYI